MSQLITPHDVLSSSGKYPERLDSPECVIGVRINAADTAERVSKLLGALGISAVTVSSGFRTSSSNAATSGAKRSAHMSGEAVDLVDTDGSLGRLCLSRVDLLHLYDVYIENPQFTNGWLHIQKRAIPSGNRVFLP